MRKHPLIRMREAVDLRQVDLAAMLGVYPSRVCKWETYRQPVPAYLLPELSRILGIGLSDLHKKLVPKRKTPKLLKQPRGRRRKAGQAMT